MPEIITRKEALALGLKRYFTGRPCKHFHVEERVVSNNSCVACKRINYNEWREKNRDKDRETKKHYYAKTRDKQISSARNWIAENPERHSAINRAVKSKRRGAEGQYTRHDIDALMSLQKQLCAEPTCKKPIKDGYHVDHIMPLARGGTNWPKNLQLLCQKCNQSKHAKHPLDWAKEKGRLL